APDGPPRLSKIVVSVRAYQVGQHRAHLAPGGVPDVLGSVLRPDRAPALVVVLRHTTCEMERCGVHPSMFFAYLFEHSRGPLFQRLADARLGVVSDWVDCLILDALVTSNRMKLARMRLTVVYLGFRFVRD